MIGVMIVDDEVLTRVALRTLIETDDELRVVAECSGPDAVEAARSHRPDVTLLDLRMPGADGFTVLRGLRALPEPPAVLMMTRFATDEDVRRAFASGASGYLLKDTTAEELSDAVRKAGAGIGVVAETVAPSVIADYRVLAQQADARADDGAEARQIAEALTAREHEVLQLVADGLSNPEIAVRLLVSPETVKSHLASCFAKLGTNSRVRAALIAERTGLLRELM
ncbi:response regulator transcription factor [Streptomyces sp. NBC_00663]|uniref:response regulator transcription factor n=1 Tax=Streptomyces sp. NBC_00663 TaxID=2975801 RepID=UPI002E32D8C8|nr:response regulator transcription factor [Streptomyces sp. NBC_00663]